MDGKVARQGARATRNRHGLYSISGLSQKTGPVQVKRQLLLRFIERFHQDPRVLLDADEMSQAGKEADVLLEKARSYSGMDDAELREALQGLVFRGHIVEL